jgi:hypothetical protein
MKLVLRVTRRVGLRPWAPEARRLLRLVLTSAKRLPEAPGIASTGEQRVLRAALGLAQSKKARQRIAEAVEISEHDAWMLQESLKQALEEQVGPEPGSTTGPQTPS